MPFWSVRWDTKVQYVSRNITPKAQHNDGCAQLQSPVSTSLFFVAMNNFKVNHPRQTRVWHKDIGILVATGRKLCSPTAILSRSAPNIGM